MNGQGNCRRIAVLLMAMIGAALICGVVVFVVAGDEIFDFVRLAYVRLSLAGREDDLNIPAGIDDTPTRFTVNSGDTPGTIASNLYNASLIHDAELFVDYAQANELDTQFEAGTYFLNQTQIIPQIALTLTDSRSSYIPFRILEGWRIEEVAEAIDNNPLFGFSGAEFLSVVGRSTQPDSRFVDLVDLPPGASLEGFLFPDTYQLPPSITPEMLRDTLTEQFLSRIDPQLVQDVEAQGMTLYEIVTLASIVEREAVHDDETPMVASVYRNRLDAGMKLDADPTVQYALNGSRGAWWANITQADYSAVQGPYNTYLNTGLPPGPIANPGLAAIRAAAYPAESDFLYFRAECNGSGYHNFALSFEDHVANGC